MVGNDGATVVAGVSGESGNGGGSAALTKALLSS